MQKTKQTKKHNSFNSAPHHLSYFLWDCEWWRLPLWQMIFGFWIIFIYILCTSYHGVRKSALLMAHSSMSCVLSMLILFCSHGSSLITNFVTSVHRATTIAYREPLLILIYSSLAINFNFKEPMLISILLLNLSSQI